MSYARNGPLRECDTLGVAQGRICGRPRPYCYGDAPPLTAVGAQAPQPSHERFQPPAASGPHGRCKCHGHHARNGGCVAQSALHLDWRCRTRVTAARAASRATRRNTADAMRDRAGNACRNRAPCSMRRPAYNASAMARPRSVVFALPPTSGVRGPSTSATSIASTIALAASGWPRCSSIMAPDQIWPIGLAMPLP